MRIKLEHYKLDENNNPVLCTLREWGDLYSTKEGNDKRRVASDDVNEYHISTVFLGLDHGHGFTKRPLLFETMIFGEGKGDGYQTRCSTWDEAVKMHEAAIQWVKDGCNDEVD